MRRFDRVTGDGRHVQRSGGRQEMSEEEDVAVNAGLSSCKSG